MDIAPYRPGKMKYSAGTQLLKTDEKVMPSRFLAGYLRTAEIENSGKCERHFKYLKKMNIPVPPLAEQRRVVAECVKREAEIAAAKAVLAGAASLKRTILAKHGVVK